MDRCCRKQTAPGACCWRPALRARTDVIVCTLPYRLTGR